MVKMEFIGWLSTVIVLMGYLINSLGKIKYAMYVWLLGDFGWIVYDFYIDNFSHFSLSAIIIGINIFGIYRIIKQKNKYEQIK
jgi:hypothetical protein